MTNWMIVYPEGRAGEVLTEDQVIGWAAKARAEGMIVSAPRLADVAAEALQDAGIASLRPCQPLPHLRS